MTDDKAKPSVFDDLDSLRLAQDFRDTLGVTKILSAVPVRKPTRQEFFRVRDDDVYRLEAGVIELDDERETYLLAPDVREQMPGDWKAVRLTTFITRQRVVGIWPLKLPDPERPLDWHRSAIDAADMAARKWVKLKPNMALRAYDIHVADAELDEPEWPDHTFPELLEIAFRDGRLIQDMEHPVIQRLLGKA
jgi:hypothetical protein